MAELPLMSLRGASVTYGGAPVFSDVEVHVARGDRICLVGRNGSGKSTLLKTLAGRVELDGGERYVLPGTTVGYVPQQPDFDPSDTVFSYVSAAFAGTEGEIRHLVEQALDPLDLNPARAMADLSGGGVRRAALARALAVAPDVLLLDEPTNHLDLGIIEWLEETLARFSGGLVVISHDRTFLRAVSGKTFWMHRGGLRVNGRGYADFERWSEALSAVEEAELHKMGRKLDAETGWLHGGISARRKRNERRLGELHALRARLRDERAGQRRRSASIESGAVDGPVSSKVVFELKGVAKSFDRPVLQPLDYVVQRGDRIGIVGRNGSGKTTFLNLLLGNLEPDAGRIRRAKNLEVCYFDQRRESLDPEATLWRTLCPHGGDTVFVGGEPRHVVSYLKDFLFDPLQAKMPVKALSGGEANRLLLARNLARPSNLLVLDEPTNDLDMDTLDMLQEMLDEYAGTILLVSHDRDFLDRTVSRVLAFEGEGHVTESIGGYSDYLARRKPPAPVVAQAAKPSEPRPTSKPKLKLSYHEQRALDTLPDLIEGLSAEIEELEAKLADTAFYGHPDFHAAIASLEAKKAEKSKAEDEWLRVEMKREALASGGEAA